jgi:plasmid stabilization system protein ParE
VGGVGFVHTTTVRLPSRTKRLFSKAGFGLISRQPTLFPIVHRQARMALPRRFPYLIIYRVFPDFISIVAVIHGKRHPRRWQARLKEDETFPAE